MSARLRVHVTPRGARDQIAGWREGALCVKLTAPPVEGAANKACVEFLAGVLGVKKGDVRIVSGKKSREKTVEVEGLTDAEVRDRIAAASLA